MNSTPPPSSPSLNLDDDEWDTDGYVIPSFPIDDTDLRNNHRAPDETAKPSSPKIPEKDGSYLEPSATGRKQKLKHKLKEADKRSSGGTGRENKIENLRELVGVGEVDSTMPMSSPKDWLDPHCHESECSNNVA